MSNAMESLGQLQELNAGDQVADLKARNAMLLDALDHITRTVDGSRTNTRRLRWIKERALTAMRGEKFWKGAFDLPANAAVKDAQLVRQKTEKAQALRAAVNMIREALGAINGATGSDLDEVWKEADPDTFEEYQRLRAIAWPEGQGEPPEVR